MNKVVYCHFSFRRNRKDSGKITLACALYADKKYKDLIASSVVREFIWLENNQYIGGIQAYHFALESIAKWQGKLAEKGVTEVQLVTDNSVLANWIRNPEKNKKYRDYMKRATREFRVCGAKEILLEVTLRPPVKYECSFKFCREDKVDEDRTAGRRNNLRKGSVQSFADEEKYTHVFELPVGVETISVL